MTAKPAMLSSLFGILETSTFRLAFMASLLFGCAMLLLFALVYGEALRFETHGIDRTLQFRTDEIIAEAPDRIAAEVATAAPPASATDSYIGLFGADGRFLAGDLRALPPAPSDGEIHVGTLPGNPTVMARILGRRLPDGRMLFLARSFRQIAELRQAVHRALILGVLPALVLAIIGGLWLALRAGNRVRRMTLAIERIMAGALQDRLPTSSKDADLDNLAGRVNQMLDQIGHLLEAVRGIGDNIAHDLRTPLTRVRTRLERAVQLAPSAAEMREAVDAAMAGLDQALAISTALLRIGDIEGSHHRDRFERVDLALIAHDLVEMYEPVAAERGLRLSGANPSAVWTCGDRALLIEAFANILDNALKFTPAGGRIVVSAFLRNGNPVVQISDTGPGIPVEERQAVMRRFYRADQSRHLPGNGLGLGLVSAVAKLHGFKVSIEDAAPGCRCEIIAPGQIDPSRCPPSARGGETLR